LYQIQRRCSTVTSWRLGTSTGSSSTERYSASVSEAHLVVQREHERDASPFPAHHHRLHPVARRHVGEAHGPPAGLAPPTHPLPAEQGAQPGRNALIRAAHVSALVHWR
jgi:hypothetical protein